MNYLLKALLCQEEELQDQIKLLTELLVNQYLKIFVERWFGTT